MNFSTRADYFTAVSVTEKRKKMKVGSSLGKKERYYFYFSDKDITVTGSYFKIPWKEVFLSAF